MTEIITINPTTGQEMQGLIDTDRIWRGLVPIGRLLEYPEGGPIQNLGSLSPSNFNHTDESQIPEALRDVVPMQSYPIPVSPYQGDNGHSDKQWTIDPLAAQRIRMMSEAGFKTIWVQHRPEIPTSRVSSLLKRLIQVSRERRNTDTAEVIGALYRLGYTPKEIGEIVRKDPTWVHTVYSAGSLGKRLEELEFLGLLEPPEPEPPNAAEAVEEPEIEIEERPPAPSPIAANQNPVPGTLDDIFQAAKELDELPPSDLAKWFSCRNVDALVLQATAACLVLKKVRKKLTKLGVRTPLAESLLGPTTVAWYESPFDATLRRLKAAGAFDEKSGISRYVESIKDDQSV